MKKIIPILFLLCFHLSHSQKTFYDFVTLGEYAIGFSDTVIYEHAIQYQAYEYDGPTPIFANMWFPLERRENQDYLKLGDFKPGRVQGHLSLVYQTLSTQMDEILMRNGLSYDLTTDEPIDYGKLSLQEVLHQVKQIETRSVAATVKSKTNFPVIVYHHGSQGSTYENSVMGEYFASKGYIFIAANFHLPYPNTIYGLLPFSLESEKMHSQSTAKAVIQFAKTLTNNDHLTFIGHSWGAQEGWCFLHDTTQASAFVSMETTIEYKSDSVKIKEMWPYVYDAIKIRKNKFSIPILLFAAKDGSMNFDFFKDLSSKEMLYASYVKPFAHNSYTSVAMMRYFLNKQLKQPDTELMLTQIKGYSAHLDLIADFLENQKNGDKPNFERFNELFMITLE